MVDRHHARYRSPGSDMVSQACQQGYLHRASPAPTMYDALYCTRLNPSNYQDVFDNHLPRCHLEPGLCHTSCVLRKSGTKQYPAAETLN